MQSNFKNLPANITLDPLQQDLWLKLETLANLLQKQNKAWFKPKPPKGIYIYGPVGRGKTMLINAFYANLNIQRKLRIHFQHFMKMLHEKLYAFQEQNESMPVKKDALAEVVNYLIANYQVICLDELFIEDIVNAALLSSLLELLYNKGMVLVITTNLAPNSLYNGKEELHKASFFKIINLLNKNNEIFSLNNQQDYRLLYNNNQQIFFFTAADEQLEQYFINVLKATSIIGGATIVNDNKLTYKAKTEHIIWLDFKELCEKPKSHWDYIALANQFKIICISNIPKLDDGTLSGDNNMFNNDRSRRFLSLIDELYDRNILLVAHFKCNDLHDLYSGSEFQFEFQRVYSRLFEMQSTEYFNQALANLSI